MRKSHFQVGIRFLFRVGILGVLVGSYFDFQIAAAGISQCPNLAGVYFCKDEGPLPYILGVTQTSNESHVVYNFTYDTPVGTLQRSVQANEEGIEAKPKIFARCFENALYEGESSDKLNRRSERLENGDMIRRSEKHAIIAECKKWEIKQR